MTVSVVVWEKGRKVTKSIPLTDITFTYDGKLFRGSQIIDNFEKIKELEQTIRTVGQEVDRFIAQVYKKWKEEGEVA